MADAQEVLREQSSDTESNSSNIAQYITADSSSSSLKDDIQVDEVVPSRRPYYYNTIKSLQLEVKEIKSFRSDKLNDIADKFIEGDIIDGDSVEWLESVFPKKRRRRKRAPPPENQ